MTAPLTHELRELHTLFSFMLEASRGRLEGPLEPEITAALRGRIATLREVLEAIEPTPKPKASEGEETHDIYPC